MAAPNAVRSAPKGKVARVAPEIAGVKVLVEGALV